MEWEGSGVEWDVRVEWGGAWDERGGIARWPRQQEKSTTQKGYHSLSLKFLRTPPSPPTHPPTHARTHPPTHARTHARTHSPPPQCFPVPCADGHDHI